MDQLIQLIKEKGWEHQILYNEHKQKTAIYFILGELKEEVILFKDKEGIIDDYVNLIKEW